MIVCKGVGLQRSNKEKTSFRKLLCGSSFDFERMKKWKQITL